MTLEKRVSRRNDFLVLRQKGITLRQIASIYKISHQAVSQSLKRVVKERKSDPVFVGLPLWRQKGRGRTREYVRARDNYTCQSCGEVRLPQQCGKGKLFNRGLDVHHTGGFCGKKSKGYDSKKDMDMLITLCHKCHYNRHDFSQRQKCCPHVCPPTTLHRVQ